MRRNRASPVPIIALGLAAILTLILILRACGGHDSPPASPESVIEQFYEYEQEADFGDAWELFHSEMKKKFKKSDYIQTKNHVFLGHMGVETFEVEIGEMEALEEWEMFKGGPVFKNVTAADVTLKFNSQFGLLEIKQQCYAVLEKDEWKVLWNYHY